MVGSIYYNHRLITDRNLIPELAAAFFLLADRPKDAVSVCIKHLQDIQLAICICRVYEGK
jgi:hypothetical protein